MKSSQNLSKNSTAFEKGMIKSLNIDLNKDTSYAIYGSNDFINSAIIADLYEKELEDIFFVTELLFWLK